MVNAYGEVNERATDDRALGEGGGRGERKFVACQVNLIAGRLATTP